MRSPFFALACSCAILLASCSSEESPQSTVASSAPVGDPAYAQLSPEDRESLARMGSNHFGFGCWVADELYFMNNGYTYSMEMMSGSEAQSELMINNPKSGMQLRVDLKELLGRSDQGGKAVAEELMGRVKAELGDPPAHNPNGPPLMEPIFMAHDQQQKLRFPDRFKQMARSRGRERMQEAADLFRQGNREESASALKSLATDLHRALGPDDPDCGQVLLRYYQLTGRVLRVTVKGNGTTIMDLSPQQAAAMGIPVPGTAGTAVAGPGSHPGAEGEPEAEAYLKAASDCWRAKDAACALENAQKALAIRQKLLGPADPRVVEVEKMIAAAKAALPNAGQ